MPPHEQVLGSICSISRRNCATSSSYCLPCARAMLGAPVRSDLIEFRSNDCDERWQLDRGRRPNDVRIDSPVLVNHKIAHARHCLPRSAGESYSSRWSDPLRRLTDDCEVEHHCTQDRVIVPEDFVRHAFDSVLDPSASVCDVLNLALSLRGIANFPKYSIAHIRLQTARRHNINRTTERFFKQLFDGDQIKETALVRKLDEAIDIRIDREVPRATEPKMPMRTTRSAASSGRMRSIVASASASEGM